MSPLRRHFGKLALLLVLLALAVLAAPRVLHGPEVATETVVQRDFVQTVVATGHVEAPHRVDIGAQVTGTVSRVPVAEGQTVKAGELLIELESSELRAAQRQAEVAVEQAQARLRQLREVQAPVAEQTLRQAQTNLDNAQSALRRNQDLFAQGFIGQAVLDDARKTVELADAQLHSARKQLETTGPSGSDTALAQTAVAQALASAELARARSNYARITAPSAGTLIGRNVEVGDVAQAGKVLMTLSPDGSTQLVADIDEKNLRLLRVGQKALASADAYPQQRFEAVLAYINPGVNAQTGAVQVKFDVPAPPPVLKQDMTVSIDIEVARRAKALLLAIGALHDADGAAPWVLRVEGGRAVRRAVRVGLRSGGFAELQDGLAEGDQVVPATEAIEADDRLRPIVARRAH
jgi:HlyD family secretion protein